MTTQNYLQNYNKTTSWKLKTKKQKTNTHEQSQARKNASLWVWSLKSESEPKGKAKHVSRFFFFSFFFKLFTSLPSDRQLSPSIHGSSYIPLSLHFCFFFTQTQRETDSDCSFWGSLLNLNLKLLLHLDPKLKNYLNHNSNNLSFLVFQVLKQIQLWTSKLNADYSLNVKDLESASCSGGCASHSDDNHCLANIVAHLVFFLYFTFICSFKISTFLLQFIKISLGFLIFLWAIFFLNFMILLFLCFA